MNVSQISPHAESGNTITDAVSSTTSATPATEQNHGFFKRQWIKILGISFIVALLLEVVVCNALYWTFDKDTFKPLNVDLPYNQQLQRSAWVVTKDNPVLNLNGLNRMINTVEVEVYGGDLWIKGEVFATSEDRKYMPQRISSFEVASGLNQDLSTTAQSYQRALAKFNLYNPVLDMQIRFDPNKLNVPLVITKLKLNVAPEFNLSLVRIVLMMLLVCVVYITVCSKLYSHQIEVDGKAYKWLNRSVFLVACLLAFGVFMSMHPRFTTKVGFQFVALGFLPYSTPDGSVLVEIPKDQTDLGNTDPYTQLTDALLNKHQVNLDLWVDPKLASLSNPYDLSERKAAGVQYYWDRVFFEGKYYTYFGLAPFVLIYAPIYLLTGLVPCLSFAGFIAALYALIGLYCLSNRLTTMFCDKCNTTLFVISKLTFFIGSFVFIVQSGFTFYLLPYLTACAAVGLALSCALGLLVKPRYTNTDTLLAKWDVKGIGAMVLCGCCVVLTVMSRPLLLTYLIVGIGMCYLIYVCSREVKMQHKLIHSLALFVPIIAGALVVMAYNQARFNSIFEFGQFYQLTTDDVRENVPHLSPIFVKNMLFLSMFSNLEFYSAYPFVGITQNLNYYGQFLFLSDTAGLMMFPFYWGLFLLPVMFKLKQFANKTQNVMWSDMSGWALKGFKLSLGLWLVLFLFIILMTCFVAGWCFRYLFDVTLLASALVLITVLQLKFEWHSQYERIVYLAWLVCCGVTCIMCMLLVVNNSVNTIIDMNPRLYLQLKEIFDPLSFS